MDVKSLKIHTNGKIIVFAIVVPFIHSFTRLLACLLVQSIAATVDAIVSMPLLSSSSSWSSSTSYSNSTFLCPISDIDTSIVQACQCIDSDTQNHSSLVYCMQILHINSVLNRFVCYASFLVDSICSIYTRGSIFYWHPPEESRILDGICVQPSVPQ